MRAAGVRRLFMSDEQDKLMDLFNEARANGPAKEREPASLPHVGTARRRGGGYKDFCRPTRTRIRSTSRSPPG